MQTQISTTATAVRLSPARKGGEVAGWFQIRSAVLGAMTPRGMRKRTVLKMAREAQSLTAVREEPAAAPMRTAAVVEEAPRVSAAQGKQAAAGMSPAPPAAVVVVAVVAVVRQPQARTARL